MSEHVAQITKSNFIRLGIAAFKEHELREIVETFCKLPGIAPQSDVPAPETPKRDKLARIIDPTAKFEDIEGVRWSRFEIQRRDDALAKAEAIMALISSTAMSEKAVLQKRPVAFRVPRTDPATAGETISATEYRLFVDEKEANDAAQAIGTDYQGLYVRDGTSFRAELDERYWQGQVDGLRRDNAAMYEQLKAARASTALLDRMQEPRVLVLPGGEQGVICGGRQDGWLCWKHPDGQWVTKERCNVERIPPFPGPISRNHGEGGGPRS